MNAIWNKKEPDSDIDYHWKWKQIVIKDTHIIGYVVLQLYKKYRIVKCIETEKDQWLLVAGSWNRNELQTGSMEFGHDWNVLKLYYGKGYTAL
jgi:hypothetical protein